MRPVWIVGYPRTGSVLLTSYLNATGMFDPPVDEWVRKDHKKLYPYSSVHGWHFRKCYNLSDKSHIEESLPSIRYIWLRRRDLVATTVSTFIARNTGVYCLKNKLAIEEHSAIPIEFKMRHIAPHLLELYLTICQRDHFWEHYLSEGDEVLKIHYEDRETDVQRVFDFLHIKLKPVDPKEYYKFQHPITEKLCHILQEAIDSNEVEYSPWFTHFEQPIPLL